MIDLLSTTQAILQAAHYDTNLFRLDRSHAIYFEDDSVLGFVCIFDTPEMLLSEWRELELSLLKEFAPNFRVAGEKAWNVYCVFLCASSAEPIQIRRVRWIEEDLARTRKLAACGVTSREALTKVLLPVLPFQYHAEIGTEDLRERLQRRIQDIAPAAVQVALNESVSPEEVVQLLGGSA